MPPVAFFDYFAFLSALFALIVLLKGWRRRYTNDIKVLMAVLLFLNLYYGFSLSLEWSGITSAFESYEDLAGALIPMMWAFVLYALLQYIAGHDLKVSENLLRTERDNLETITRNIGAGLVIISQDYKVLWKNAVFNQIFGDVQGMTCFKTIYQLDDVCPGCRMEEIFKGREQQVRYEHKSTDCSGNDVWFEIIATPIRDNHGNITAALELFVPITNRKLAEQENAELERQLRLSQKMEAVGTLAGGIAHDFNNILSAILGYTSLAQINIDDRGKLIKDLDQIYQGAIRARELIYQILTLSRRKEIAKQPLNISVTVKEALKLLRSSLPASIEIKKEIISRQKVLSDPTQIHQIVMNLCTNAYHAMRLSGGVLTVSLTDIDISEDSDIPGLDLPPGKYVLLMVEDTGHGMNNETIERIFDPYFTTKEMGEGTGLGLAVIHGIVKSHQGHILVDSETGKGTMFKIYFPVFEGDPDDVPDFVPTQPVTGGDEKILFVDDEKQITDFVRQILEKYGYSVTVCFDGQEALQEFKRHPNDYDLLITDMTMPKMNGTQLAKYIRELRPRFPIILCSGYSDVALEKEIEKLGLNYFEKPIEMKALVKMIRTVFDQSIISS